MDKGDSLLLSCGLSEPFGRWAFCVQCLYVERSALGGFLSCEGEMREESEHVEQRHLSP